MPTVEASFLSRGLLYQPHPLGLLACSLDGNDLEGTIPTEVSVFLRLHISGHPCTGARICAHQLVRKLICFHALAGKHSQ